MRRLAFIWVLFLASCGGGGGSAQSPQPSPPPPTPPLPDLVWDQGNWNEVKWQ